MQPGIDFSNVKSKAMVHPRSPLAQSKDALSMDVTQTAFLASEPSGVPTGAYILAPSDGNGNDAMRVKNGGSRLGYSPHSPLHILRSVSEPSLKQVDSPPKPMTRLASLGKLAMMNSEPSSPEVSPKTPRTMRGSLRQASILPISVRRRKRMPSVTIPAEDRSSSTPASPSTSRSKKRVSFEGDVGSPTGIADYTNCRSMEGERQVALSRSKSLLSSLYDLRRATDSTGNAKAQEMTLMNATLSDLKDSEERLRETEQKLLNSHEPVAEHGGSRFATTLVSQRTLAVVQRKALLLNTA